MVKSKSDKQKLTRNKIDKKKDKEQQAIERVQETLRKAHKNFKDAAKTGDIKDISKGIASLLSLVIWGCDMFMEDFLEQKKNRAP